MTGIDNQIEVLPVSQFDNELRFSDCASDLQQPQLPSVCVDGESSDSHHRRPRSRDARGSCEQPGGQDAGALDCASSFLAFDVKNELKTEAEVKAALEKL